MSGTKPMPKIPEGVLTQEQIEQISGGLTCSPDDWNTIIATLRQNYDTLVDFTSYVFEQVGNAVGYTP